MKVRVLFFGALSDVLGRERLVEVAAERVSVADLRNLVASTGAERAALADRSIRAAVDQRVAVDREEVRAGQEVAFFSPVSGG